MKDKYFLFYVFVLFLLKISFKKIVLVLLSSHIKRFSVFCMQLEKACVHCIVKQDYFVEI